MTLKLNSINSSIYNFRFTDNHEHLRHYNPNYNHLQFRAGFNFQPFKPEGIGSQTTKRVCGCI